MWCLFTQWSQTFFLKPLFRYSIHKAKNLCYMCIFCYCLSLLLAFKYDATFDIQCTMCFVIPTQMLLSHFIHAINLPEKDRSYTRSRHNRSGISDVGYIYMLYKCYHGPHIPYGNINGLRCKRYVYFCDHYCMIPTGNEYVPVTNANTQYCT